ncbi:MAG: hypothetical protein Q8M65_11220, partial [Rhodoglobus sp.]|nr:hypothetical protein [Rhodoglobus sp.]
MDDIDAVLSSSLKRIAAPGDAAGVADAIRARVDAGDTGTPATTSGFGGGAAAWLPWLGLVVVAGLVGGALGPLGALGAQNTEELVAAPTGVLIASTPAYRCVGGPTIGSLSAGERVLTIERSDDSSWLGIRNPDSLVGTIWLPASVLTVDEGLDAAALPTGG